LTSFLFVLKGKLQYLSQDDFKQYIGALAEHQDHLAQDPSYIKVFHQQHLGMTKLAEKRDSESVHNTLQISTQRLTQI